MIRKVCIVSREMEGVAGAGGMKDAVRGIAGALVDLGIDVTVVIPLYRSVEAGEKIREFGISLGGESVAVCAQVRGFHGIRLVLLDADPFRSKDSVYTYTADDAPAPEYIGKGHLDADEMNVVLQAGATRFLLGDGEAPDIIHGHDGHAGLMPLFLKPFSGPGGFFARTGVVVTIHNAGVAYQQAMGTPSDAAALTGLPEGDLAEGVAGGEVNPLLIAARFAVVNTVSPWYAREIVSPKDGHSGSLGAAYRAMGLRPRGITNGIDPRLWGKAASASRSSGHDSVPFSGKGVGRSRSGLPRSPGRDKGSERRRLADGIREGLPPSVELIGAMPDPEKLWVLFHGRVTGQKGLEELISLPEGRHAASPYAMLVLGKGEKEWEDALALRCRAEGNWAFFRGYDADLARRLFAASSLVLVPSEWEPCGQIDMIGQLHGALPVVRRVGGLRKIRRFLDGFGYSRRAKDGLRRTLETAILMETHAKTWVRMMRRHAENVVYGKRSWRKVVIRGYLPLYREALGSSRRRRSYRGGTRREDHR